jgi:hypothetical protein
MKVVIAGSRSFNDYSLLRRKMDHLLQNHSDITIISGTARGADKLGEKYAKEKGYDIIYKPADWDNLGKRAGYVRNEEMAKLADVAVIFWDGESRGAKHMMDLCDKYNVNKRVIRY